MTPVGTITRQWPVGFHARDWHKTGEVKDGFPRSKRTNICEIPNYVFVGGTIDQKTLQAIDCPKCLVMLDGYLESGELRLLPEIVPHSLSSKVGLSLQYPRIDRRLLHGREQT